MRPSLIQPLMTQAEQTHEKDKPYEGARKLAFDFTYRNPQLDVWRLDGVPVADAYRGEH
jgi:hypothetical protein